MPCRHIYQPSKGESDGVDRSRILNDRELDNGEKSCFSHCTGRERVVALWMRDCRRNINWHLAVQDQASCVVASVRALFEVTSRHSHNVMIHVDGTHPSISNSDSATL